MNKHASRFIGLWALFVSSFALQAQDRLNLEQAIEMALAHDPRIEEKKAFVRQAEGLLQEAEGSEGFQYMVDSFLAIATGVDGGFFEDGEDSCSGNCEPRDDLYDVDDGLSLWAGLTFAIVKPLATFGRLDNFQEAAQSRIASPRQAVARKPDEQALQPATAHYR